MCGEEFVTEFESVCHILIAYPLGGTQLEEQMIIQNAWDQILVNINQNEHNITVKIDIGVCSFRCVSLSLSHKYFFQTEKLKVCLKVFEACAVIDFFVIYDGYDTEQTENKTK